MNELEKILLKACKEQHTAIDLLFSRLIMLDKTFMPSKSGVPWEAVKLGNKAIKMAEATPPVGRGLPFKLLGIDVKREETVLHGIAAGVMIGPGVIKPTQHDISLPAIGWKFTAKHWLAWIIVKWLYRKNKKDPSGHLHEKERAYMVFQTPSLAEKMEEIIKKDVMEAKDQDD